MDTSHTKIFLDSGNPEDTKDIIKKFNALKGQTTNPSLVAKHPQIQERIAQESLSEGDILDMYKSIIQELREILPDGSISIEVYADHDTSAETMYAQAREMNTWIDNAHIKLPITSAGLEVAHRLVREGIQVNMTLCFTQEQAIAVHRATIGAQPGQVYISPFVGRLDDIGQQGTDLVAAILKHYAHIQSHVSVLGASIRSLNHMNDLLEMKTPLVTVPKNILDLWIESNHKDQPQHVSEDQSGKVPITFQDINYDQTWNAYNISADLTDKGLQKFAEDWKKLFTK